MTKKEALKILIQSASRDIKGTGCGIRSTSEEWRKKVCEALYKIYPYAYDRPIDSSIAFNLGIPFIENDKEKE